MTYEQRIVAISEWFKSDIVPRFSMPKDIDPKVAAKDAIEATNSAIHSKAHDLSGILSSVVKTLTSGARSRTLPTTKEFRDAASAASKTHMESATFEPSDSLNTYSITAKRIRALEPIGDFWLRGRMRQELLDNTDITDADLVPYEVANAAYTQ